MASAELPSKNLASIEPAATPQVTGTPRVKRRALRNFPAFWFVLRAAGVLWITDVALVLRDPPEYPKPATQGMFAALFLGLFVCGCLGALLQIAWSLGRAGGAGSAVARLRGFLLEGSEHRARVASLLALPIVLALYATASVIVNHRIVTGMVRPELAALALTAAQPLLLTAAALAFWPARAVTTFIARGLSRVPGFRRAWQTCVLLFGLAVVALALFGFAYREPLAYLPWRQIAQVVLALALGGAIGLFSRDGRAYRWLWPVRLAAIGCTVAGLVAALSLAASTGYARRTAEHSSLIGKLAYGTFRSALDRDGDGYLSILGDGDCAVNDAKRNPGATDVPGNRVDEDCDGFDLDPSALAPRGRYDFPVPEALPQRPPIILLTIDAFAADRMKLLGGARGVTPNLDRLAERSVFFTNAYSQGPSTRLSFPSMFTSRWDSQIRQQLIGKHPFPIEPSEVMLAERLRTAGYDTVAVLGDGYFSQRRWKGITRGFSRVVNNAIEVSPKPTHNGPLVTDEVLAQLQAKRDRPLFLWAHYYDAHSPFLQPKDVKVYGSSRADVYDAELTLVDREVGRLITAIDEAFKGQALVIITADHGIAFDEPRHAKFNYGYDLSTAVLHVPLLFHAGFLPPRKLSGVVSTMDIVPTLLNLLRVPQQAPPKGALEGTSLIPEIVRGERSRPAELMSQMFLEERLWKEEEPLERVSLRTDRFNLMHDRKAGYFELFEYPRDYFEARDLTLDPSYEANLRQLKRQLSLLVYVARKPDAEVKKSADAPEPSKPDKAEP
jgi:arylsulfatase A-like enzyme